MSTMPVPGDGTIPAELIVPTGRVIWLDVLNLDVNMFIRSLQQLLPTDVITVAAVWPSARSRFTETAHIMTQAAIGIVQSLQLELGQSGTRANVVIMEDDQVEDLQRTISYFHGPDGGFVAGCTFDLRPVNQGGAA